MAGRSTSRKANLLYGQELSCASFHSWLMYNDTDVCPPPLRASWTPSYVLLTTIQTLYAYFIEGDIVFVGKRKTFDKRVSGASCPLITPPHAAHADCNRADNAHIHHQALYALLPTCILLRPHLRAFDVRRQVAAWAGAHERRTGLQRVLRRTRRHGSSGIRALGRRDGRTGHGGQERVVSRFLAGNTRLVSSFLHTEGVRVGLWTQDTYWHGRYYVV